MCPNQLDSASSPVWTIIVKNFADPTLSLWINPLSLITGLFQPNYSNLIPDFSCRFDCTSFSFLWPMLGLLMLGKNQRRTSEKHPKGSLFFSEKCHCSGLLQGCIVSLFASNNSYLEVLWFSAVLVMLIPASLEAFLGWQTCYHPSSETVGL